MCERPSSEASASEVLDVPSPGRVLVTEIASGRQRLVREAEVRLTKAQLQAAPTFTYEAAR